MCFIGAVPIVGNAAKSFAKSERAIRNIIISAKTIKWIDRSYGVYYAYDFITQIII